MCISGTDLAASAVAMGFCCSQTIARISANRSKLNVVQSCPGYRSHYAESRSSMMR